ncbi:MAG: hypothetical protein Q7J84_01020 [Sulfuricaulis sp.]|nr:hypothetical protein [Sulfuricaulis sp.]
MKSVNTEQSVVRRLNVMIALMLDQMNEGQGTSMAAKIVKLSTLGLASSDIAEIVGKPLNYVTATLAQRNSIKKGKK